MSCDIIDIDQLRRQFLCCTPINKMSLMSLKENKDNSINADLQKKILDNTVNYSLVKQYPIKRSYQRAFLKLLMKQIEEYGDEVDDNIYTAYCDLISSPDNESVHYRHFLTEQGTLNYLTVQESTNLISEGTTGLCSWQGAISLSDWCIENKSELSGKVILELGCGVGLTGLSVITNCSPKLYVFSDCHEVVLSMVCKNVKFNLLLERDASVDLPLTSGRLKLKMGYRNTAVEVINLKWEDIENYMNENCTMPDIIIAADILYESSSFYSLTNGLKSLLISPGSYAIIAATVRNADTISQFLSELENHSLTFEECAAPQQTVSIQVPNAPIRMLKIFRKS